MKQIKRACARASSFTSSLPPLFLFHSELTRTALADGHLHVQRLQRWLSADGHYRYPAKQAARLFFEQLVDAGVAHTAQLDIMLKECCYTSGQMRSFLDRYE